MYQSPRRPEFVAQATIDDGIQPKVLRLELERIPTQIGRDTLEYSLRDHTGEVVPIGENGSGWDLTIWWDGVRESLHVDPEKHVWRANMSYRHDDIAKLTYVLVYIQPGAQTAV